MAINRDKILKGAEKLVQRGKVEQAIREYEKLLKLNPNDVNTINRVGDLYNRIGQTDRAVELYERIADAFAADGFASKAIAIYKKINRLAPDRVEIFERLADLYIQQGLIFEAQNQFQVLADWFVKNNDFDSGIKTLRKLVQIDADNHMAHLRLADLLFRVGASDEAMGVYERLGAMLLSREKVDEAERLFRHALEQDPPKGEFLVPICEALVENGNVAAARDFLAEGLKRSPESTALKVLGLRVSLATGETAQGLETARQLLQDFPDSAEVRTLAGKALLAGGEGAEGRGLLVPVARKMIDEGDRAGALEIFRSLIQVLPQDREVLDLGIKSLDENEDQEMVFTLRAALADSFFKTGDSDQARRLYNDLLQEDPGNTLFAQRVQVLGGHAPPAQQISAEVSPPFAEEAEVVTEIEFELTADEPEIVEFDFEDEVPEIAPTQPEVRPPVAAKPADFDPQERLAEANVFAKYGLVDKALVHLEKILHFFPGETEAREKLVHLAVEAGRTDLAEREGAVLAQEYRVAGDSVALDNLRRSLPDLMPDSGPAPMGDAATETPESPVGSPETLAAVNEFEMFTEGAIDEPDLADLIGADDFEVAVDSLAADDEIVELDEIEFEEVEFEERVVVTPVNGVEFDAVDPTEFTDGVAPVVEPETSIEMEVPAELRSVESSPSSANVLGELAELEESVLGGGFGAAGPFEAEESPTTATIDLPPARDVAQAEPVSGEVGPQESTPQGPPEADIEQLDSFIEASLYEDAARLLSRLEADHSSHDELVKRRLELKSKGFLIEAAPEVAEASEDLFADEAEDYIDLAAELEEELAAEEAVVEEATGSQGGEAELEEVFREFQKGVAQQLSEEDSDTHFNLGIAYKEMGLLPEAIREFQIASRDASFFVECCSMVGVCYAEQGMWDQAAPWYRKALEAPGLSQESVIALKYDLANVLRGSGDDGGAAGLFEEILAVNPAFRDVSVRLSDLGSRQYAN